MRGGIYVEGHHGVWAFHLPYNPNRDQKKPDDQRGDNLRRPPLGLYAPCQSEGDEDQGKDRDDQYNTDDV